MIWKKRQAERDMDRTTTHRRCKLAGFTLVESAIVLIIIGLIIGVAASGFYTLLEGQRLTKTRSGLDDVKQCLMRRLYASELYPSLTNSLTDCSASVSALDVDFCLCESGLRDGWNRPFLFIQNLIDSDVDGMDGYAAVSDILRGGQLRTLPSTTNTVTTTTGEVLSDVAYILLSYGADGLPGDASYGNLLAGDLTATMLPNSAIDFTNKGDDLYILITSRELAAALRR